MAYKMCQASAFITSTAFPTSRVAARWAMCEQSASDERTPAQTAASNAPKAARMRQEEQLSAAERTRRQLTESEPLVKFRKQTEYLDRDTSFRYTSGVKKGSVDIWLITGVLTFLVPLVGFAIGVLSGNIDINPR